MEFENLVELSFNWIEKAGQWKIPSMFNNETAKFCVSFVANNLCCSAHASVNTEQEMLFFAMSFLHINVT